MPHKYCSLKKSCEYKITLDRGKKIVSSAFVLFSLDRKRICPQTEICPNSIRIGITASRKVGNAVTRNFIKRRFRHLSSEFLASGTPGFDYVIIARKSAKEVDYKHLQNQLNYALNKTREAKC